ncbi:hypothetical protein EVAR_89110_1 [Eumeta japonica]|uniref:Uncharacterized protein n=1 Tax=Eumeta variegata TaxID=151549 RepID=A0A4C1XF62_EUMVA|nr:hypothetical protein EVAR_89110_1 [Eumeta japonica]
MDYEQQTDEQIRTLRAPISLPGIGTHCRELDRELGYGYYRGFARFVIGMTCRTRCPARRIRCPAPQNDDNGRRRRQAPYPKRFSSIPLVKHNPPHFFLFPAERLEFTPVSPSPRPIARSRAAGDRSHDAAVSDTDSLTRSSMYAAGGSIWLEFFLLIYL